MLSGSQTKKDLSIYYQIQTKQPLKFHTFSDRHEVICNLISQYNSSPAPPAAYMCHHCNDVIMTTMASQITSLTVIYSTVYSDADQRKHQSSASLAFVWGIHRDRWIPRTKGQLRGKCFHLMTSSWFKGAVSYRFSQGLLTLMCNNSELKADINFFFFLLRRQTS